MKKTTLLILLLLSVFVLSSNAQTYILNEDFSAVINGNSTSTSGSGTTFAATTNFPTVSTAYQAGGAIKLGSSSAVGSLTTKSLDLSVNGGVFSVSFDVKGWTTVEGDIKVTITGQTAQTVTYTTVLASSTFETKTLNFTGGTAGSTVKIETTAKRAFVDNIKVYYNAPTCTASNLAFAQPVVNKLAADAAFTQTATSLNATTAITYTSSNTGVATVNETTGEVTIAGAGSTVITAAQAAGTHNAVDYCAATTTYTVNVASAAPTITVTEISVPDMVAYVGQSDVETMNVSGINLTENIALAISGTNADQFSLSTNSVAQTAGTAANTVVLINYNPTSTGAHTATLTISSAGATTVTRTLNGSASWAPLDAPVANEATGVSHTTFTANWNAVAGATEYELSVVELTTGGAQVSVLTEDFAGFTAGSANASADATDKATALDGLTGVAGWTGAKVYQAGGATKLGSSSSLGSLVTPAINLSANGGAFTVAFRAMAWSGDSTKVKIYVNDVLAKTVTGLTNDANYTLNTFSADLTGGTASTKIKFEGNQAAKGRVFLDDVVISQGGGVSEAPVVGSPFTLVGETSKDFAGLVPGTTFKYSVVAKNANVTSAASNQITVTTTPGTGLNPLKGDLKVYASNGSLMVETESGKVIEVYNAVGQKLMNTLSVEGTNTLSLKYKGVVMVKVGAQLTKVVL